MNKDPRFRYVPHGDNSDMAEMGALGEGVLMKP